MGFLRNRMGVEAPRGRLDAETYLALHDQLESRFIEQGLPVHSFPDLSAAAYAPSNGAPAVIDDIGDEGEGQQPEPEPEMPYAVDDIVNEGCFLERGRLESMLDRLRSKKNLILQGPPGTGKTWLARKLAFALIGSRSERRVRPFQFHPNLSYEDFVRDGVQGETGGSPWWTGRS